MMRPREPSARPGWKPRAHFCPHTGIISRLVSTSWVKGHHDNSPVPYLGTLPPSLTDVMREQQMDAILETAFNDQTGDWAPFSNWTLQTLTLKRATARYSSQNRGRRAHFYPSFCFFQFQLCLALVIMLSLVLVASGNSRWEGENYPRFSMFFSRRLSEAGFGFIQCRPFGSTSCCFVHPLVPDSPAILCFVNGCLWWPINTGRLGMGFSITKVVPQHTIIRHPLSSLALLFGDTKYSI